MTESQILEFFQFKGWFFRDNATKPRIVDILVGQIEARLNENESKPNDSGVNLNFEKWFNWWWSEDHN